MKSSIPYKAWFRSLARIFGLLRESPIPASQRWLLLRILLWWGSLRVLRLFLPVKILVRLSVPRRLPRYPSASEVLKCLHRIETTGLWSGHGNCLPRALACHRYLTLAGLEPALYIGFEGEQGHAWVEVGAKPFIEPVHGTLNHYPTLAVLPGSRLLVHVQS